MPVHREDGERQWVLAVGGGGGRFELGQRPKGGVCSISRTNINKQHSHLPQYHCASLECPFASELQVHSLTLQIIDHETFLVATVDEH